MGYQGIGPLIAVMDRNRLQHIARLIRGAIAGIGPPAGRTMLTKALYETLTSHRELRNALRAEFGGPIACRYAGCPPVIRSGKTRKVLGYLWDFSFSRHAIPEAIKQNGGTVSGPNKYEILFVLESELGTFDEICRDLLKLLEARAAIRCLVYKQPTRDLQRLHTRLIAVLHNHAHFNAGSEHWLFMGLSWGNDGVHCDGYVLAADGAGLLPVAN